MLDIKLEKQLPVVQMNFEEVKASLIAGAAKYKGIIVTEDNLKDCKVMQKELSKTKNDLETYRKGIKKEMLIPVTKFENQCKELVGLVVDVETPIKESILVFDDEAREKKRLIALEHINTVVKDLLLDVKHASLLIVQDEYANVSISVKKIKEDIEKRGFLLQQEQQQEAENLQIIKDTIENCNKSIDAKMDIEDFKLLIEMETISTVLHNITSRAERIKDNEVKAVADKALKAEKEVQDRIAKAEREVLLKAKLERDKEEIKLREKAQKQANLDLKAEKEVFARQEATVSETFNYTKEVEQPIKTPSTNSKKYFIEMRVQNMTIDEVTILSEFLKSNGYEYNATKKGAM